MIQFPLKFEVSATAPSGTANPWTCQADKLPPIPVAIPPEFHGPGGGYSPEDLYGLALLNCLLATLKVYLETGAVAFEALEGKAIVTADKLASEPGFLMSQVEFFLTIRKPSDPEKAKKIADTAIRDSGICNSVKSGKTYHIAIA